VKFWSILFGVTVLTCLGIFLIAPSMGWWLPRNVCVYGGEVDDLYYIILWVTAFFFVLTEGILIYNMWSFGYQPGRKAEYAHGNHRLEIVWTVVPAGILLFIAFAQIGAWERIKYRSRLPEPEQIFEVSARQFEWRIRYPASTKPANPETWSNIPESDDVYVVNEVHIWKGGKVKLYLKTRDVIHSFFLPNLRIKQDALPGKVIPVWFEATDFNTKWNEEKKSWDITENWELACAELCGWGHYKMQGKLVVHPDRADFDRWLAQAAAESHRRTP
jgi:cytochrome c oxidase subunit 2